MENDDVSFSKKDKIISIIVITGLTVILCVLWILFVNRTGSSNNTSSNENSSAVSEDVVSYSGSTEISSDENITSGNFSSDTTDENAISVFGDITVTLSGITVNKTGDSDGGDNTSFYGINSAIIAKDGANLTIKDANITTDAVGANGVFSYGGSATTNNSSSDGTTVNIADSTITTSQNNSGGIMTTGGGIMNAENLIVTTAGGSSAAIRTDRGGGTVVVNQGTYKTTGNGSPAIYSTADVTVKNATLIAEASEGAIIEGKNNITLENVDLTDTNSTLNGQSTTYKNIFLYQSMSGDAATGKSVFTSKNSTITTNKGDVFYVTNTTAEINLENNSFISNDASGNFLRIQKDSWGKSGENGGVVALNMTNQVASGNIVVDAISSLAINLSSSSYSGTINGENAGEITLVLDKNSTISLTGDSYIDSLTNADSSNNNIVTNGYKLYVGGVLLK